MSGIIDELEIEIKSNAETAAKGIDLLTGALKRMGKADSGTKALEGINVQLERLKANVSNLVPTDAIKKAIAPIAGVVKGIKKIETPTFKPLEQSAGNTVKALKTVSTQGEAAKTALVGIGNAGQTSFSKWLHSLQAVQSPFANIKSIISNTASGFRGASAFAARFSQFLSSAIGKIPGLAALRGGVIRIGEAFDRSTKKVRFFNTWIGKALKSILMYRILRNLMTRIIRGFRDGMANIVMFSDSARAAMNSLSTDVMFLRNSMGSLAAPIVQALAPAFTVLVDIIHRAITALGMFFALLGGQSTFVRATRSAQEWGGAAGGAMSDVGNAAEKAEKQFQGAFDELNMLTDNRADGAGGGGGGGAGGPNFSDMFEEVEIPQSIHDAVEKLKRIFAPALEAFNAIKRAVQAVWSTIREVFNSDVGTQFFKALWRAWYEFWGVIKDIADAFTAAWIEAGRGKALVESVVRTATTFLNIIGDIAVAFRNVWTGGEYGKRLFASMLEMFTSISDLLRSIGESFRTAFNDGTGERIIANILRTFTNINNTVMHIADNIRIAWEDGGIGERIWGIILGIVEKVSETISDISGATAEWARRLNFSPAMTSFENLLSAIRPVVDIIADGFAWAWKNVLLPFGKWLMEFAVPKSFDLLARALRFVTTTINVLKPAGQWLWENFLRPLANLTRLVITGLLFALDGILIGFTATVRSLAPVLQAAAAAAGVFLTVWKGYKTIIAVKTAIIGLHNAMFAGRKIMETVIVATNTIAKSNKAAVAAKLLFVEASAKKGAALKIETAAKAAGLKVDKSGLLLTTSGTAATLKQTTAVLTKAGVIGKATAAQLKLNVAMKANPIGLAIAGITALAAGIFFLATRTREQTDEQIRLAQETENLRGELNRFTESAASSEQAHRNRTRSIESEIGAANDLVTALEQAIAADDGSVASRQRVAQQARLLNNALGEEVVTYNELTGEINKSISEIRNFIDTRRTQLQLMALEERYIQLLKEQSEATANLGNVQEHLNATLGDNADRFREIFEQGRNGELSTREYTNALNALANESGISRDAMRELNNAFYESKNASEMAQNQVAIHGEEMDAFSQTMIDSANIVVESYDEIQVAAIQALEGAIEAHGEFSHQAVKAFDKTIEAGVEWSDEIIAAYDAVKEATSALSDQITSDFETASNAATDSTRKMNVAVRDEYGQLSASVEEELAKKRQAITETVMHNAQATREWGDNISALSDHMTSEMARGVDQGVIEKMMEMARECPQIAQAMADDIDWVFDELAPALGAGMDAAMHQTYQSMISEGAEVARAAEEAGVNINRSFAESMADSKNIPLETIQNMTDEQIDALLASWGISSPSTVGIDAGESITDGLSVGIEAGSASVMGALSSVVADSLQKMRSKLPGFLNFGRDAIDRIQSGASQRSNTLVTTFTNMFNQIQQRMQAFSTSITTAFQNMFTQIQTRLQQFTTTFLTTFQNKLTQVQSRFQTFSTTLTNNYATMFTQIQQRAESFSTTFLGVLQSKFTESLSRLSTFSTSFTSAFSTMFSTVQTSLNTFSTTFTNAFNNTFSALQTAAHNHGAAIAQGLANGINANAQLAIQAAQNMANAVNNIVASVAQISSPSKIFFYFGKMIGLGLELGIESMFGNVKKVSEKLADCVTMAINGDLIDMGHLTIPESVKRDISRNDHTAFNSGVMLSDIKQAVYDAVASALSTADNNDRPINFNAKLEVDGRELHTRLRQVAQDRGDEIFTNGFAFGL